MVSILTHADEAKKFCNDPKTWEHFSSIIEAKPDDIPLQILHALKIGLCVKIQDNSITTNEAIQLFNDMVDTAANNKEDKTQKEF